MDLPPIHLHPFSFDFPFRVASSDKPARQIKFRRDKNGCPAGLASRIFLRNFALHRAQFTPQIPQCVPNSLRFGALVLNNLHGLGSQSGG
jgi:hypothetical protein